MSLSFPPGCTTLKTSDTLVPGLRTLAATRGKEVSLALVNDADTPQELRVSVPGSQKVPQLLHYNYFTDDRLVDKDGFPLPKEILTDWRSEQRIRGNALNHENGKVLSPDGTRTVRVRKNSTVAGVFRSCEVTSNGKSSAIMPHKFPPASRHICVHDMAAQITSLA